MKDRLHGEISAELEQTTRTDKTTVIVAIVLNFIFLFANMGFASGVWSENYNFSTPQNPIITTEFNLNMLMVFIVLAIGTVIFNLLVVRALSKGVERRAKLTEGLVKMYQEEGLDKYYDSSIIEGYKSRYGLYKNIVIILGIMAVLIPSAFLGV